MPTSYGDRDLFWQVFTAAFRAVLGAIADGWPMVTRLGEPGTILLGGAVLLLDARNLRHQFAASSEVRHGRSDTAPPCCSAIAGYSRHQKRLPGNSRWWRGVAQALIGPHHRGDQHLAQLQACRGLAEPHGYRRRSNARMQSLQFRACRPAKITQGLTAKQLLQHRIAAGTLLLQVNA